MTRSLALMQGCLLAGTLTLSACAAVVQAHSYTEPGSDVRRYRTYTLGPADRPETGDPRLDDNRFFNERVQKNVDKQLFARGYEAGGPNSDLVVHYHASVTQKLELNDAPRPDCYRRTSNGIDPVPDTNCRPYVYDVGTLLIDVVDRKTQKVVWRGWAEGSIDGVLENQQWMEERVDEAVTKIMAQFPRRTAAAD